MTDRGSDLPGRIARRLAVAWSVGVLALTALAIGLGWSAEQNRTEGDLRSHALAVYGLAWFDDEGFHDEYLELEPELFNGPVRLSVATPEGTVYGDHHPRWTELADQIIQSEDEIWLDLDGDRVLVLPSFNEDDVVVAAIIARTTPRGILPFALALVAGSSAFILVGLLISRGVAARVLEAEQEVLAERERILAGAAHELRTPLATLSALVQAPDENTLTEVADTVQDASEMVARLLTWSRLAHAEVELTPVRLDLLVEVCLDEDTPFEGAESVVQADPRLLEVAVRNLLQNARVHGGGVARVTVDGGRVCVEDNGPGIPSEALLAPFTKGAASPGTGLGLALVSRIAEKHGGVLEISPSIVLALPTGGTG